MAIKSKKVKRTSRESAKVRIRKKITKSADHPRISVFKSSKHTYAQIIVDGTGATVVSASTLEKAVMDEAKNFASAKKEGEGNAVKSTKSVNAAKAVGKVLAMRAKEKKVTKVVFDRNGFIYTGRISAVADGAREGGLEF